VSGCIGIARLKGARPVHYAIAAGATKRLRFRLSKKLQRKLNRRGSLVRAARARNADADGGTVSRAPIRLRG
jgi:hypothetical protein